MLPKWYPHEHIPFDGNFIENHCIAIQRHRKIAVLFVHSGDPGSASYELIETEEHGFPVIRVFFRSVKWSIPGFRGVMMAWRYFRAQLIGYKHLVKQFGHPGICHIHVLSRPGLLALWLHITKSIPFLITEHWSGYYPIRNLFKGVFRKWMARMLVRKAEVVTTVSTSLQRAMEDCSLHGQYEMVPNSYDPHIFHPATESALQTKRILHVSTLDRGIKRFDVLLSAFDQLAAKRDDFDVVVLGDGPDRQAHESSLQELDHIKDRIRFLGDISLREVANHMREASFIALYSTIETQSVVIMEALACGTPFVAGRVGGLQEHYDGYGSLVDPHQKEELIAAMDHMLDHSGNFDSEQLRKYAHSRFSAEEVGSRFESLYQAMLS